MSQWVNLKHLWCSPLAYLAAFFLTGPHHSPLSLPWSWDLQTGFFGKNLRLASPQTEQKLRSGMDFCGRFVEIFAKKPCTMLRLIQDRLKARRSPVSKLSPCCNICNLCLETTSWQYKYPWYPDIVLHEACCFHLAFDSFWFSRNLFLGSFSP